MSFTQAIAQRLEGVAEQVRRNMLQMIRELQGVDVVRGKLVRAVSIANATNVVLKHGFGRPAVVLWSPPRFIASAGYITEDRTGTYADANQAAVLYASGYGATVQIDVWMF